ncbi:MAG: NAD(P)H-dependent oxidoreductase [Gammaproteobacteria bacterium]|nr:NAD(P)H-dependent oxidoreductase [Gammaproteobacteria bacterium]
MTTTPAILVFAGSARRESLNKKLARTAADSARATGAEVTLLDLRDYPIPLYDGDLEAESGVPENARALRRLMATHHGLIVVSPEYNGFITPLLKNTLDWISRPDGAEDGLTLYRDKVALVLSASPGALGGLRSLQLIRQLLGNLGVTVLPDQLAVGRAQQAFSPDGTLTDAAQMAKLNAMTARLHDTLRALY